MHCKYEGCKITTRNGHRNINWEKWQLCKEHAWELHSDELSATFFSGRVAKVKKSQYMKRRENEKKRKKLV